MMSRLVVRIILVLLMSFPSISHAVSVSWIAFNEFNNHTFTLFTPVEVGNRLLTIEPATGFGGFPRIGDMHSHTLGGTRVGIGHFLDEIASVRVSLDVLIANDLSDPLGDKWWNIWDTQTKSRFACGTFAVPCGGNFNAKNTFLHTVARRPFSGGFLKAISLTSSAPECSPPAPDDPDDPDDDSFLQVFGRCILNTPPDAHVFHDMLLNRFVFEPARFTPLLRANPIKNNNFQVGDTSFWTISGPGSASIVDDGRGNDNFAAQLITGSPISLTQSVHTLSDPFDLSFDYWFQTTSGNFSTSLDSVLLNTLSAPSSLASGFKHHTISVTDPNLFDLVTSLDFTLDGLTGSELWIDNIVISNASAAPVPEPGTWLLMVTGLIGLALFRRRFQSAD